MTRTTYYHCSFARHDETDEHRYYAEYERTTFVEHVSHVHPFALTRQLTTKAATFTLLAWRPITAAEWRLYQRIRVAAERAKARDDDDDDDDDDEDP